MVIVELNPLKRAILQSGINETVGTLKKQMILLILEIQKPQNSEHG